MLIGMIVGGVLLLSCCCTGIGGGFALWYWKSPGNNAHVVGKWRNNVTEYEFRADGKMKLRSVTNGRHFDLVYHFVGPNVVEFKGDTAGNNMLDGQPYPRVASN